MKKILILLFILFASPVFAYTNPGTPTGYVNDYAGVLSAEQKQTLENKLTQFEKDSSNEISVVTIKSLAGDTIENYAVKLFEDWGIGKKDKDNGVLVLIALDDRQMRIEVGYGLEGALTDAQSYWIINDVMKPAFRSNDYYGGINKAVDKIIAATKGEYVPEEKSTNQIDDTWITAIWFVMFGILWFASILGRSKSWWAGGVVGAVLGIIIGFIKGFVFFGIASLVILIPFGLLFDFIVSKSYAKHKASGHIPWWIGGGRGGGGFSGGGFGGFGGGGSGGGGASGGW